MKIRNNGFIYVFSETSDGNMSYTWGGQNEVDINRSKFLKKYSLEPTKCVKASLVHGTRIKIVTEINCDCDKEYVCDSLITNSKKVVLCMVTADCFPLVIFDPKTKLISLTHLGHRGVSAKLTKKVIKKMQKLGSEPTNLVAIIGAGIRKESYVFDDVTQKNDPEWGNFLRNTKNGKISVDLVGFIVRQLTESGVMQNNIRDLEIDTAHGNKYFSHYRAQLLNEKEGRFLSAVKIT